MSPGVRAVSLGRIADLVALEWEGPARARVELRFRVPGGGWSGWAQAGADGHEDDSARTASSILGAPIWTGGTAERAAAKRAAR